MIFAPQAFRDAKSIALWGLCMCTCLLAVSLRASFSQEGEVSLTSYGDDHRIFAPLEEFRGGSRRSLEGFGDAAAGEGRSPDLHENRARMKLERLQSEKTLLEKRKWDILSSLTHQRDAAALEVARQSNELHRQRLDSALDRAKARQKRLHKQAQDYFQADQQARQERIDRYMSQAAERVQRQKYLDDLLVGARQAPERQEADAMKQTYNVEVNRLIGELAVDASRVNNVEERDAMLGRIRELDDLINRGPEDGAEDSKTGASARKNYIDEDWRKYAGNVRARAPVDPQGAQIIQFD